MRLLIDAVDAGDDGGDEQATECARGEKGCIPSIEPAPNNIAYIRASSINNTA